MRRLLSLLLLVLLLFLGLCGPGDVVLLEPLPLLVAVFRAKVWPDSHDCPLPVSGRDRVPE